MALVSLRSITTYALVALLLVLASTAFAQGNYQTVEWTDLIPKDDLEAFLNPPDSINEIADGSDADKITNQIKAALDTPGDSRYQQALVSTKVIAEFDGKAIRIPGFIVPLEFGVDRHHITKFFLVPYFGACIHVPPPPPNQIVYAEFKKGFKLSSLYDPFWLYGTIKTTIVENDTATAAYSIEIDSIKPYTEE